VAGAANPELRVAVEIVDGERTTAVVRLTHGLELLGVRRIAASSCDEALAAVVAVTALALSSTVQEAPSTPAEAVPASSEPVSTEARAPLPASAIDDHGDDAPQTEPAEPTQERWRLLAGVGMDVGTLEAATLAIGVGAALRLGPGEARALARYGPPTSQHEREEVAPSVSTGSSTHLRADFAAAALDYCLGIDAAQWLGACGGVELALTRSVQVAQTTGLARRERERFALGLGPVAGVALVLRAVPLQPQLELSAQWHAIGAEPAAQPFGLRAIFGGAVPF